MRDEPRSPRSKRSKRAAAPPSLYEMRLDEEAREVFAAAGAHLDLTDEIRFARTVLATLSPELKGRVREASTALRTLKALIDTQVQLTGSESEVERALINAAERILDALTDLESPDDTTDQPASPPRPRTGEGAGG